MSSGILDSFQGWGSLGNPTGDCDSAQAGSKGSSKLGGQQSQISFPFLPQYPSPKLSFFSHVLKKKYFPPPANPSQTANISAHVNQKDLPNLGAEGRKPAALLFGFCTPTCSSAPLTIKYELIGGTSVILPFARANPRVGCGLSLSWLWWEISGGFFFLLLPCVFAVQALTLFADSPSVLPYVCHQDLRLSRAQRGHWSEHHLMHLPALGWDRPF